MEKPIKPREFKTDKLNCYMVIDCKGKWDYRVTMIDSKRLKGFKLYDLQDAIRLRELLNEEAKQYV